MQAGEPQTVLMEPTQAAIFLVVTVNPGSEAEVRDVLADVGGLRRSVGLPRAGGSPVAGRRHRLGDLGRPLRSAPAGRAASVQRARRGTPHGALDTGRPALPHPRRAPRPLLRARTAADGGPCRARPGDRRGARVPLVRPARPARVRRRHREPGRRSRARGDHDRRRGRPTSRAAATSSSRSTSTTS